MLFVARIKFGSLKKHYQPRVLNRVCAKKVSGQQTPQCAMNEQISDKEEELVGGGSVINGAYPI